jgi:hypothetical protein
VRYDQRGLGNEEDDPKRERRTMDVHKHVRQWSAKQAGEKVCASEADQDRNQRDSRHSGEEEIVVARMQARARSGGGHEPSSGSLESGRSAMREILHRLGLISQ